MGGNAIEEKVSGLVIPDLDAITTNPTGSTASTAFWSTTSHWTAESKVGSLVTDTTVDTNTFDAMIGKANAAVEEFAETTEKINSGHVVEVVPVVMLPHDNADTLSIVEVFGGYTCVVKTADWIGKTTAAYIPPDSLVDPTRPEFSWILSEAKSDGLVRVRACKKRGVISMGLLVPIEGYEVGTDVTELLGVKHYQPGERQNFGGGKPKDPNSRFYPSGEEKCPDGVVDRKYDLENWRKYSKLFVDGENVIVTEKLDGTNSRFVFKNGRMYCGSRNMWKQEFPLTTITSEQDLIDRGCDAEKAAEVWRKISTFKGQRSSWFATLDQNPSIERWCRDHEGDVLYGEIAGTTNMIKYGANRFAAFDILRSGRWVDKVDQLQEFADYGIPTVPLLYRGPYDRDLIKGLAEGKTTWTGSADVLREGCVVVPERERYDRHVGRIALKCVGAGFLERYKGE